ncbi:protein amnionless [Nilaparvata lugens]|uniref:protein amnionless n=1 Tax=Nilaparvata lugens TaxID=108931 RepID=UPI00193C8F27|nr:protein amnionless [Nilaparvata lugens]
MGEDYESRTFSELVAGDVGRAAFLSADRTRLPEVRVTGRGCNDVTGCECGNQPLRSAVCAAVQSRCSATRHCLQPVTPHGSCCSICGGYVIFKYGSSFNLEIFKIYLERKFANKNVNTFASKVDGVIQAVFVESGEYEGNVDDYVRELKEAGQDLERLGLEFVQEFASGPYVSQASFTSVLGLLIGLLFLALAAFAVIFCVHSEQCNVNSSGQRQYLFAVFENQGEEVELCKPAAETPVVPPRRSRQAFDNPMYGAAAQDTLTPDANSLKEGDDGDVDEEERGDNADFPSSMMENNHIYATMETIDLLGKYDLNNDEQTVDGNEAHDSG